MAENDTYASAFSHPHQHSFWHHLASRVEGAASAAGHALRPLPTDTADGTYTEEDKPHSNVLKDISNLGLKDVVTIKDLIKETATSKPIDDKKYFMEGVIKVSDT